MIYTEERSVFSALTNVDFPSGERLGRVVANQDIQAEKKFERTFLHCPISRSRPSEL